MNKRIIWLIIGLMSLAVIGVVALQTDLVLAAIRANEEAFDKNVQSVLSIVAQEIENDSYSDDYALVANGYSKEYFQPSEVVGDYTSLNGGISVPIASGSKHSVRQAVNNTICASCKRKQLTDELAGVSYDYINRNSPIEERINAQKLAQLMDQELENQAIRTPFEFGVFSNEREEFVIHDGQYLELAFNKRPQVVTSEFTNLFASPYKVTLFEDEQGKAAGQLKLFFPERTSVVWSALLPSFLGTFLFAALILACFGYTLWVIFHQKRISEMKTDFINNMTHEFKTPIATISLAADSISSPRVSGDVDKVLRFVNIIKQENKRMNNQVEKVLQMAQIDRGESKLRLSEVNLNDVVTRAIENISLQVEPRHGTAKAVLQAKQPMIEGDMTHVSNVINNLLDNANKYSPDTPTISVTTKDLKDGVQVTVSDRGMGMSKEARKHIFDKFYRVHTGDLHDVKGFGLGLSYVKAILDAHGGTINVKSELGKGSDFILFFPRKQTGEAIMN